MTGFWTLAFRCSIPVFLLCIVLFPGSARAEVDYSRDILPILAERCFSCHGADGKKRKAGLRLDVRESALGAREGVRALGGGRPGASAGGKRVL